MIDDDQNAVRRVTVRKTKSSAVEISLRVRFEPEALGSERAQKVWDGLGAMLAGILTPEERADFMERLRRRVNQAASHERP